MPASIGHMFPPVLARRSTAQPRGRSAASRRTAAWPAAAHCRVSSPLPLNAGTLSTATRSSNSPSGNAGPAFAADSGMSGADPSAVLSGRGYWYGSFRKLCGPPASFASRYRNRWVPA